MSKRKTELIPDEFVDVIVLAEVYGPARQDSEPIGRKGDVIRVTRAEYERCKGGVSIMSGKSIGASLRLKSEVDAEAAAVRHRVVEVPKQNTEDHMRRRAMLTENFRTSQRLMAINARRLAKEADEAAAKLEEMAAKLDVDG